MTQSVWRYSHLALAVISSLFLVILSITGVILAVDAVFEDKPDYNKEVLKNISIAQSFDLLDEHYPEIMELSVDYNQLLSIKAFDNEGNSVEGYISPETGKIIRQKRTQTQFIQWTTALHRSLFLKETGRIMVGTVSFLLFLISCSGIMLIIKRQQGFRNFFAKIHNDFFAQYFHVVSGRLLLIPVVIISLTGTYLFMLRTGLLNNTATTTEYSLIEAHPETLAKDFDIFRKTMLSDIQKLEFPFIPDDPDEYFILKLKDKQLTIHQLTGETLEETKYPYSSVLETLNIDLHTGRTNVIWAIILGIASLNILIFIYTGFSITFKRTRTKIRNKYKAEQSEIILLVGTENGSTLFFANQIHKQLLDSGQKSFLDNLNNYKEYPKAKHLLIFTSTYGLGDAPSNALKFEHLFTKLPPSHQLNFSIVGFGSKSYPDFCAYAQHIDKLLATHASRFLELHTVNDKSADEFVKWVQHWSEKAGITLTASVAVYQEKIPKLQKFKVVNKTEVSEHNDVFKLLLKPSSGTKFQSGDLLAIYPENKERLYSIARHNGMVQLIVKLHPQGLGSGYLYNLNVGESISTKIMTNPAFHLPKTAESVALIANGTGIAPFLGMISNNHRKANICLYAGFKYRNEMILQYEQFAEEEIRLNHLNSFQFAFSREQKKQYVLDLVRKDADYFTELLQNNGLIMICGSLNMQRDIETILNNALATKNKGVDFYKMNKQILTDCY